MPHLTLFPFVAPQRMDVALDRIRIGPEGIYLENAAPGERLIGLNLGHQLQVCRPLSKSTLERVHLEKFRLDFLMTTGVPVFEDIRRNELRPDFIVDDSGKPIGIDVTALALSERRLAYSLFATFLRRVWSEKEPFSNLQGTHVLLWFDTGSGMPPKRHDHPLQLRIISSLREVRVDRGLLDQALSAFASSERLGPIPAEIPIVQVDGGKAGYSIDLLPREHQPSAFAERLGFECSLSMMIFVHGNFAAAELRRLIKKHDKRGVDWLLVSCGAPDRNGTTYPQEEILFDLLRESTATWNADHIRRVTLHKWTSGQVRDLPVTLAG